MKQPKINKILYCTDLGRHTAPVFMHALAQAEKNNASITIIHVVEPMSETAQAIIETYMVQDEIKKIRKDGMERVFSYLKTRIDKFLREECGKSIDEEPITDIKVVAGRPSEEILNLAEEKEMDLIVMGKSSNKIRGSRVMGSTARRVNRLSKVPVLVVPNRKQK